MPTRLVLCLLFGMVLLLGIFGAFLVADYSTNDQRNPDIPDVPAYPGAWNIYFGHLDGEFIRVPLTDFCTSDKAETVLQFYESRLKETGWVLTTVGGPSSEHVSLLKHGQKLDIDVLHEEEHVGPDCKGQTGIEIRLVNK